MAMREFLYDTKPLPEEPDDLVVINPTRVNEPDGAILVYRKEGVLVFDGKQIPIGKIVEGYVSNSNNNPYLPVAYHIPGHGRQEHRPYPRGAGLRMGPGGPETAAGGDCAPGIAVRPTASAQPD